MMFVRPLLGLVFGLAAVLFVALGGLAAPFRLPGRIDPSQLAINAASKQLAPIVAQQQPVRLDFSKTYPESSAPPGSAFRPRSAAANKMYVRSVAGQLAGRSDGVVSLPPGDYEIPVRVYCTNHHAGVGSAPYEFGPLEGARKDVLVGMYAKVTRARVPWTNVQGLSWSLQAGMRYAELPALQRATFDRLIPSMRNKIAGNYVDQLRDQWNQLHVPGLPPFDQALDKMGLLGQTIGGLKQAQSEILANANNFDALRSQLVLPTPPGATTPPTAVSRWAQVSSSVYMHTSSSGGLGGLFNLQLRVVGTGDQPVAVPLLSQVMYPINCKRCQPLTFNVETNEKPSEGEGRGMPG